MVHTDAATDGMVLLETPVGGELAESFSNAWRSRLVAADLDVRQVKGVVINPLGSELSAAFPANQYAQLKISVSQSFFLEGRPWRWETLKKLLLDSLALVGDEVPVSAPEYLLTDPR